MWNNRSDGRRRGAEGGCRGTAEGPQDDVTSPAPSIRVVVARPVSYGAGYRGTRELRRWRRFLQDAMLTAVGPY